MFSVPGSALRSDLWLGQARKLVLITLLVGEVFVHLFFLAVAVAMAVLDRRAGSVSLSRVALGCGGRAAKGLGSDATLVRHGTGGVARGGGSDGCAITVSGSRWSELARNLPSLGVLCRPRVIKNVSQGGQIASRYIRSLTSS